MNYCTKHHYSDLHIEKTKNGEFECQGCLIGDDNDGNDGYWDWFGTIEELWWHLQEHLAEGHKVSENVLGRVEDELYGVDQGVEFKALLYKLAAPKMVMDFYVMTGRIIELLDNAEEDGLDFDVEELLNHPAWEWND